MGICKWFSSPDIVKCLAIAVIPKRKILGAAYSSSSSHHNYWNISSKDFGSHFKEKNWVDYKEKIGEIKQVLLKNLDRDEEMNKKENLILVDAIQRVGIERHFDEEIETILGRVYNNNLYDCINDDLYYVSLYFRLLRNQGYYVSADVFDYFKGNDGKFKEKLGEDIRGLMELHEASQLRFIEEAIFDEAEEFSRVNLNKCLGNTNIDDWHKKLIKNTLRNPQHKNIARLNARNYIDGGFVKGCKKGWGKTLIEVAKMDVIMGDLLHKDELLQISKWWGNVGIAEELQRARNQPMKWYTWSMAILIDYPSLQVERIELTKAIAFVYLIDDIFDLYGNLNELTLFTQAIYRWEYGATDILPEYMRKSYRGLLDTTDGIARKVEEMYGINPIHSLKETWGNLCGAFLVEARWLRSRELPTAKEYLENGQLTSGAHLILLHLFFLLGLGRGHSSINLNDTSTLISSIATILRLSDDLGTAEDEQQDGWDGSYIKCSMNDVPKLSLKEAREDVEEMISKQWKNLNKECFLHLINHSSIHCFKRASLNAARMEEKFWVDYEKKFEEIKQVLLQHSNRDKEMNKKESLILVDAIQRVGIDHYFDEEIEIILARLYDNNVYEHCINDDQLYYASLYFRLLINQGYYVSADMFNDFKGSDGKFKGKIRQDIRGLIEFHETAQLRFIYEDIMDEAQEFSRMNLHRHCLENMNDDDWNKKVIRNALRQPQHKSTARYYMDGGFVKGCKNKGWIKTLTELARMDVIMEELLHQEELLQVYNYAYYLMWWENVGIVEELRRGRSQPMKWYIRSMVILINNPSLRVERIELTKVIAFIYLIDDIFHQYGNLNELTLFTQAINRWEYGAIDTLPEYMRTTYKALLDTTNGIALKVEEMYGTNPIDSLKATEEHQDGSYMKCCMSGEPKLSVEEARQHVKDMISNQWKILNMECFLRLNHSTVSCFRRASLNFARLAPPI